MSQLYLYANIIYEMSLYLLILGSYLNWTGGALFLLTISMIISVLITGAPSTYHLLGYNVSKNKTDREGYFKLFQFILLLGLIPILSNEYIPIVIILILIITLSGISNRVTVYKQIQIEKISFFDLSSKIKEDTFENKEFDRLFNNVWKMTIPFFLLGLSEQGNLVLTFILLMLIIVSQVILLRDLFFNLLPLSSNTTFKKDFTQLLIKSCFILFLLTITSLINPGGFLNYVVGGLYTKEIADFIHREGRLKQSNYWKS